MKRLDIVQLVIMIIGIISALFFIQAVPVFLLYIFRWMDEGLRGGMYMESLIISILNLASYSLLTIYSIKYSKSLAEKICDRANFSNDLNFALNKGEVLFSIFIGIAIYGLIKNIPPFLSQLYKLTKPTENFNNMEGYSFKSGTKDYLIEEGGLIILYIVLLIYANVFADLFAKKMNNIEPPDSISLNDEV